MRRTRKRIMWDTFRASIALIALITVATGAHAESKTDPIETKLGTIVGIQDGNVKVFQGIRYAEPPTGDLRFMPPVAASGWDGTLDATTYPNHAMQAPSGSDVLPGERGEMSEDCLFLNIYTPSTEGKDRPVLFWIHGGSFTGGSANGYDGSVLAEQGDVVVVVINYRLGVFGFLNLSEQGDAFAGSAMNGIRDQILALEWVRDNIADYGGDAGNVMIFGESAGGESVLSILASPSADDLYHKAISHSGFMANRPPGSDNARKLAAHLNVESSELVDALRALSAEELLAAQITTQAGADAGIDGTVVTRSTLEAITDRVADGVPLITGYNHDEGTLFSGLFPEVIYGFIGPLIARMTVDGGDPTEYLERLKTAFPEDSKREHFERIWTDAFRRSSILASGQATEAGLGGWLYRFDLRTEQKLGDVVLGATHASEIPFTFNIFAKPNYSGAMFHDKNDPGVQQLAEQWSNTVIAFARTGNPNGAGLPEWPRYSADNRQTLILDANPRIETDVDVEYFELWEVE